MHKFKLKYFFILFFSILAVSCSPRENSIPLSSESNINYNNVKAEDFASGQLEAHYLKHGYQFGNITQDQYLADARNLLDASTRNDVLQKIRPNGDIMHYRRSTGEFAVMTSNGRIRTYFKTDSKYWMRQ